MTAEAILFDPEFEGLLREAAAEPGSCLLKVPRPKLLKGLFERSEPISDRAAELSKVERHLVQVYRCEMAWLLRQACLIKLIDGPRSRLFVSRHRTVEEECERLTPDELSSRIGSGDDDQAGIADCLSARQALNKCTRKAFGGQPCVADLASLSFHLEPTDSARILVAMDLSQTGAPRTGMRLLRGVLEHAHGERIRVSARSNLSFAYSVIGDNVHAHRYCVLNCSDDRKYIAPWVGRLFLSIQLGMQEEVQEVSRRLEEFLPIEHPALESYIQAQVQQRKEGGWSPTRESIHLLSRMSSSLPPVAGRIADVFA